MRKIFNWFIPKFLTRLDVYLLERYPMVWCTRVHFVLFYAFILTPLLFFVGFYSHISATFLQVDPITPIDLNRDEIFISGLLPILIWIFDWIDTNNKFGHTFSKPIETLITLLIYSVCFWVLIGITAPAYRLGTIYHTAWYWMDEADLQNLEKNYVNTYGFVLLEGDSVYSMKEDSFYDRRELAFREICHVEDSLLLNRYNPDTTFWNKIYHGVGFYVDDPLDKYIYYTATWSNLAYTKKTSYLFFQPDLANLAYETYRKSHAKYSPYRSRRLYSLFGPNLSLTNQPRKLKEIGVESHILGYSSYKKEAYDNLNSELILKYGFSTKQDSIDVIISEDSSVIIKRPQLPFSVENAIRSVKHARQYLEQGVFWTFLYELRFLILSLSLLLYLRVPHGLNYIMIPLTIFGWLSMNKELIDGGLVYLYDESPKNAWLLSAFYLCLPLIGLLLLLYAILIKKQHANRLSLACGFISLSIAGIFLSCVVGKRNEIGVIANNFVFGAVLLIGVAGAFLMTYAKSLPNKN